MKHYVIISADCHAGPESPVYRDYLDPQYRERFDDELKEREALIAQMRGTLDTRARAAISATIQRYIADKALWTPLWTNYVYLAFQPRVHGVLRDPQGNVILNNATLSS